MTTSQLNRRNARRATGPRTPEGKAIVARNATRHGLLSSETVLPHEDREVFEAFRAALVAELAPVGELEELLADRVVSTAWRLRRAGRAETLLLTFGSYVDPAKSPRREAESYSLYLPMKAENLRRYETTIERSMFKALHELQRLQAARAGQAVPPPLTVDVTFDGG